MTTALLNQKKITEENLEDTIFQYKRRSNTIVRNHLSDSHQGTIKGNKLNETTQVEVQTQIGLWSDPDERIPVCYQTEITGSGRKFERTTVWTMVWRLSDQRSMCSENSDHRRIRAHLGWSEATSSAIGSDHNLFVVTFVWSETTSTAIGSDHNLFERSFVWSEATSSALGSDQKCFRTQLGLIRGHFERIVFFHFFVFFLLRNVGSTKRQP